MDWAISFAARISSTCLNYEKALSLQKGTHLTDFEVRYEPPHHRGNGPYYVADFYVSLGGAMPKPIARKLTDHAPRWWPPKSNGSRNRPSTRRCANSS